MVTSAATFDVTVWTDEFGEGVWKCTCSPDLHGGYTDKHAATRAGASHLFKDHGIYAGGTYV